VDWSTTCFCCQSVLQKRWQFCDRSAWISKILVVRDSSQSCCSISPCHQDLVRNFEASGSTLKKKGGSVKTVRTPENIAVVREAIERSPHRSARRHSVSLGLSEASVRRILHKDLHFCPYKIQVTHALHERDYVNRVNSCVDASKSNGWLSQETYRVPRAEWWSSERCYFRKVGLVFNVLNC
jgi:hypothetical protein